MQGKKKIGEYVIDMGMKIGEGATGKVYLCHHNEDEEATFAVKIIDKCKVEKDQYMKLALKREFLVHHKLKHPHIVRLIDMVETKNNIYIVQEYCQHKTLENIIKERKKLSEADSIGCIKQICMGFTELVKKGVIHRDLKPENILISENKLKIADFGFAKDILTQKQLMTSIVGSPIYMAPQILMAEKYTSKCDVWSLGIIFFQLLYGRFPWVCEGRNMSSVQLIRKVLTQPLAFPEIPEITAETKDFIECCLQSDEEKRLSWLEVFQNKIFQGQFDQIAEEFRKNYEIAANLLNQLAVNLRPEELIGAFLHFKVKALDFKQFETIFKWLIPKATEIQLGIMYQMFDKDGNGVIDLYEFVKAFEVCEDEVALLLHNMIEDDFTYEELKKKQIFDKQSRKYEKNQHIRNISFQLIDNIIFSF